MPARPKKDDIMALKSENAKLKAENKRLKKAVKKSSPSKDKGYSLEIFRKIAVVLLVSLAVAVLSVGNLFFWIGNTVAKQDRFVAATQPIIKDPEVQRAIALYTTNKIFSNIDVEKITEQVLPPRADFLAPQLAGQLKGGTQSLLEKVLAKPSFQQKWNDVLARQHQRLINVATKYQGDGTISLNDVYNRLASNLKDTKLSFLSSKQLPSNIGEVTVVSAPWLPAFHNVVTHIDTWRIISVIAMVVFVALAAWLSRNRRRTIYIFSIAAASFMAGTLVALRVIRETVADKTDPQYTEAVRHVMQIVFHSLVLQTATIMAAAILVALIAWISGNSRRAKSLKKHISLLFSGKLHAALFGPKGNRFTHWVAANRRGLQWAVLIVLTLILLIARLTLGSLLAYVLLLVALILAIEVIAGSQD